MVVKFHYHRATERRYWNFSTIVQTKWVLEFQYPCEMRYWNCSTIVQAERVRKFQYPPAKCGTEISVPLSKRSGHLNFSTLLRNVVLKSMYHPPVTQTLVPPSGTLNYQIYFRRNTVLKFECSFHIERWALSTYVSIYRYWLVRGWQITAWSDTQITAWYLCIPRCVMLALYSDDSRHSQQ